VTPEFLTPEQAAAFLQLPSVRAFYDWRKRHNVPNRGLGRALRVYRSDLVRPSSPATVDFRALGQVAARGGR
jgi:hypothetical protein